MKKHNFFANCAFYPNQACASRCSVFLLKFVSVSFRKFQNRKIFVFRFFTELKIFVFPAFFLKTKISSFRKKFPLDSNSLLETTYGNINIGITNPKSFTAFFSSTS